jgi:hypothetical protein
MFNKNVPLKVAKVTTKKIKVQKFKNLLNQNMKSLSSIFDFL